MEIDEDEPGALGASTKAMKGKKSKAKQKNTKNTKNTKSRIKKKQKKQTKAKPRKGISEKEAMEIQKWMDDYDGPERCDNDGNEIDFKAIKQRLRSKSQKIKDIYMAPRPIFLIIVDKLKKETMEFEAFLLEDGLINKTKGPNS